MKEIGLLLLHKLSILCVTVASCNLFQLIQGHSLFEELLRVSERPELLKRGKVRVVLFPDLAVVVHRFRGEPTWTMEVEVGIERLLIE